MLQIGRVQRTTMFSENDSYVKFGSILTRAREVNI